MLWEYSHGGKGMENKKRWMHKMEQQAQAAWFSCQSQHSSLKLQSVQRRKKNINHSFAFPIFSISNFYCNY